MNLEKSYTQVRDIAGMYLFKMFGYYQRSKMSRDSKIPQVNLLNKKRRSTIRSLWEANRQVEFKGIAIPFFQQ